MLSELLGSYPPSSSLGRPLRGLYVQPRPENTGLVDISAESKILYLSRRQKHRSLMGSCAGYISPSCLFYFIFLGSRLEGPSLILSSNSERDAKFEELQNDAREIVEEGIVVLGILLDPLLERLVLYKRHISWKHHKGLGALVFILIGKRMMLANK
jgi:hypothetical protein